MINTALVSLAVAAGIVALAGVPLRCSQLVMGRLRARIPPHPIAQTTFGLFSALFFAPAVLAWGYAFYAAYMDWRCGAACGQIGVSTAFALGILGSAYFLLEGFLLVAQRRRVPRGGD
jgi:hypothetical protein